jgi:N-acyl-D-aspartate/D-glutamate deacylase
MGADRRNRRPRAADVGIRDGRIVRIGRIASRARQRVDAPASWWRPFIDVHTHADDIAAKPLAGTSFTWG